MYRIQKGTRNGQAWFYLIDADAWKEPQTKDIVAGISFENGNAAGEISKPNVDRYFEVVLLGWRFAFKVSCVIENQHRTIQ